MIRIVLVLLAVWLVVSVLGFILEGLFWLAVVGVVLFVATAAFGAGRRTGVRGRRDHRAL
ncbi:hypothetical protein GB931_01715 [Modestobacter sp. I12A-02628]|uniref:Uncharacterized protein n=1 Tax=Goekera deserti TaxID=2497753 RepID=A0A7K3WK80_9ACTN|nr:hypothetical protein [Goekera deserti]NDI47033.1 hypothetical protein [Goekera deserti]NEL56269.1 hypothetical protein [Goekera deserti]